MDWWDERAGCFDNLDWANDVKYLGGVLASSQLEAHHHVLDVGCGTGRVTKAIAPHVQAVTAIDTSPAMLEWPSVPANVHLVLADVRNLSLWPDNHFDGVIARMVLHHVLTGLETAIAECYRVLQPGGRLVVAEGIPPHPSLRHWFARMMAYKEERNTFLEGDLVQLLATKFDALALRRMTLHAMSLRNWLDNCGASEEAKSIIWTMHAEMDERGREHYNLCETEGGDMVMDWTVAIAVGIK